MKLQIASILFVLFIFNEFHSFAQDRTVIRLDQELNPILEDGENHAFNQILSTSQDGSSLSKIFDLQNRIISQTKERYNEELGYNESITSTFDSLQNLITSEILNLDNGNFVRVFLDNQVPVSRLEYIANENYKFFLADSETPLIESEENPMDPTPAFKQKEFFSSISKTLKYPGEARAARETGTAWVKIKVDKEGNAISYSCLNESSIHISLANEAVRVIKKFDPKFKPAIGIYGEPVAGSYKIPIRFMLD
ncbi:energy transducer TonB [Algoriphagus aestuarii]|nr:energy transducer TonB [Algoriphagus aestuarii]